MMLLNKFKRLELKKPLKTSAFFSGLLAFQLLLPASLTAAPVFYSDEAQFLSAAQPQKSESFESHATTGTFSTNSVSNGDFTASVSGNNLGIVSGDLNGSTATDGDNFVRYQSGVGESITFSFNEAINSFGINITDWGDWNVGELIFSNSLGDEFTVAERPLDNGNHLFFGVFDSALSFDTVTFTNTAEHEAWGFDELYYGTVDNGTAPPTVDEPATLSLVLFGLLGMSVARRRRARS